MFPTKSPPRFRSEKIRAKIFLPPPTKMPEWTTYHEPDERKDREDLKERRRRDGRADAHCAPRREQLPRQPDNQHSDSPRDEPGRGDLGRHACVSGARDEPRRGQKHLSESRRADGPRDDPRHNDPRRNDPRRNAGPPRQDRRGRGGSDRRKESRDVEDPRGAIRQTKHTSGRNSASFDPSSTFCRPDLRVRVGSGARATFGQEIKHDDVILVADFVSELSDLSTYHALIDEIRAKQSKGEKDADWLSWHEGCHLISKAPDGGETFAKIISRICEYFAIRPSSAATRFNWYKDSADWKPFHHDSAAFNPSRAKRQNITVGVSFGEERELAFMHASSGNLCYLPQSNGMCYAFGRDVNIKWKHGVNALPPEKQTVRSRDSVPLTRLS